MNRHFPWTAAWGCLILCLVTGCQESPYELAQVHGSVTVDGQPMTEGKVMFAPAAPGTDAGKAAFGPLQSDGTYVLTTIDDGDGAVVGGHWVTVLWPKTTANPATPVPGLPPRGPEFARFKVRELKKVVAGEDNQIDIQLTRQDIARGSGKKN